MIEWEYRKAATNASIQLSANLTPSTKWSWHLTPSEAQTHYTKWSEYVDPLELEENLIPGNDFHSMGTGDVTLAYDDAAKGSVVLGM